MLINCTDLLRNYAVSLLHDTKTRFVVRR